ncbi:MAG: hypothetical protein OEY22_01670 [Candidatus Bathyarchaeota archaeon]|nr:hypothetical protein [Candidatus Bathyarchaeota archaeon]
MGVQLCISFILKTKTPIDIINEINELLGLDVKRGHISHYTIEIGRYKTVDQFTSEILVHHEETKQEPNQTSGQE